MQLKVSRTAVQVGCGAIAAATLVAVAAALAFGLHKPPPHLIRALELTPFGTSGGVTGTIGLTDIKELEQTLGRPVTPSELSDESRQIAPTAFGYSSDSNFLSVLPFYSSAISTTTNYNVGSVGVFVGDFSEKSLDTIFTRESSDTWVGSANSITQKIGHLDASNHRFEVLRDPRGIVITGRQGDAAKFRPASESPEIVEMVEILGDRSVYDMTLVTISSPLPDGDRVYGRSAGIALIDGIPRVTLLIERDDFQFSADRAVEDYLYAGVQSISEENSIELAPEFSEAGNFVVMSVEVDATGSNLESVYASLQSLNDK